MRIEDIESRDLSELNNDEIYAIRLRFMQMHERLEQGRELAKDFWKMEDLVNSYHYLAKEITSRGIKIAPHALDKALEAPVDYSQGSSGDGSVNLWLYGLKAADFMILEGIREKLKNSLDNLLKTKILIGGELQTSNIWAEIIIGNTAYKVEGYLNRDNEIADISFHSYQLVRPMEATAKSSDFISFQKATKEARIKCGSFVWSAIADNIIKITNSKHIPDGVYHISPEKIEKQEYMETGKEPFLRIITKSDPEYIVGGLVYEADTEDAHGDFSTSEEIWKALKSFMINKGDIKIQHAGKSRSVPVVECYHVESDHTKGGKIIKKGSWWMSVFLGNEMDLWEGVQKGELTGFSMAGLARKV